MSADLLARERRRRAKVQLSCNPCRKRKVRCDRNISCKTCLSRGEPDICLYERHPPAVSRLHQSEPDHKPAAAYHARLGLDEDSIRTRCAFAWNLFRTWPSDSQCGEFGGWRGLGGYREYIPKW
ncbi:hypothetical protein BJX66DRAFT_314515 [Aspergillus keveii]|uniref:Zn(2)-C6 fungal-type domain-containing protein n=1 Tax=Aspergillus keveii TaxID=714993 RepID=A0ABR4FR88_9EURO